MLRKPVLYCFLLSIVFVNTSAYALRPTASVKIPEILAVLDNVTGDKTGEYLDRDTLHKLCKWHRTVHGIVFLRDGRVVVQNRSKYKKASPNKKDVSIVGHVIKMESDEASVIKEGYEELSLILNSENLIPIGNNFRKIAVLEDIEPYYNESGVFIYHSNYAPNNEYSTVYCIVTDATIELINKALEQKAQFSSNPDEQEVEYVEGKTVDEIEADILDPIKSKNYASSFKQHVFHKKSWTLIKLLAQSLKSGQNEKDFKTCSLEYQKVSFFSEKNKITNILFQAA